LQHYSLPTSHPLYHLRPFVVLCLITLCLVF
jgi:hypothetical protein